MLACVERLIAERDWGVILSVRAVEQPLRPVPVGGGLFGQPHALAADQLLVNRGEILE